jgi:hypothetical protein
MPTICTPEDKFGPFQQHLFCGCSVIGFSASAGWNDQEGTCTIQLVEDDCSSTNDKKYWNADLVATTTNSADPGFFFGNGEPRAQIGTPAYFRVEDFEFVGLIQSWKRIESARGNTYEVKLVDPREILRGAQLIIGDYAGRVSNSTATIYPYNIFNVFGFMEQFGTSCLYEQYMGGEFGSPARYWGGMDVNDNAFMNNAGMQYNAIKVGLSILTSNWPAISNDFSKWGRILFRGISPGTAGYGIIKSDNVLDGNTGDWLATYFVDISELPPAPSYFRINQTSISILDLISYSCKEAGYDYYIELVPVRYNNQILKVIKVRTVDRAVEPPSLNHIQTYLESNDDYVTDRTVGRELRNEETTNFLIGGNIKSIYQASEYIEHFWGVDANKDVIVHTVQDNQYIIPFDLSALNLVLNTSLGQASVNIEENELRAALDSPAAWLTYAVAKPTAFGTLLASSHGIVDGFLDIDMIGVFLDAAIDHKQFIPPRFFLKIPNAFSKQDSVTKDLDTIYNHFSAYAREYYGKKWQIQLPKSCWYFDEESQQYYATDVPSTDGAWTEYSSILGLPHPSVLTQFFSTDEQGKTGPILRFVDVSELDLTLHNIKDYGIYSDALYLKADIDPELVYGVYSTHYSPRVVLTIPEMVTKQLAATDLTRSALLIAELLTAAGRGSDIPAVKEIMKNQGSANLLYGLSQNTYVPSNAAVPLESRINCYGPWCLVGRAGKVKVEKNENLVPWEYGGESAMNVAAGEIVQMGITSMQIGELGQITIAGYPERQLGDELGAPVHVPLENKNVTQNSYGTYFFFTYDYGGPWDGTYGPNITNINVTSGPGGVKTSYSMRTFTPQFGRYSKANSERYRQLAQQRLAAVRNARLTLATRELIQRALRNKSDKSHRNDFPFQDQHSVVELIVGQQYKMSKDLGAADDDFRHQTIGILPEHEQSNELENYSSKAFMGLEGLLRSVSRAGDGGLPQYVNLAGSQCSAIPHLTEQSQPPVNGYTPAIVNTSYLDPLTNPSDTKHGTSVGHDIDLVARDSSPPESLSIMVEAEKTDGVDYTDDYRFMALRGPLMVHGWGYDTNGKPIPNESDSDLNAEEGTFEIDDVTDNFMEDWLRKSHCWPVAPVDLRYDRKRGVWTTPPNMRMLLVESATTIAPEGSVNADVRNYGTAYDDVGDLITDPQITLFNPFHTTLATGMYIAYFDSADCKYYPISAGSTKIAKAAVCGTEASGAQPFQTLTLGTGLILRDNPTDSSDFYIHGGFWGSRTASYGLTNMDTGDSRVRFDQLSVGSGLSAYKSDCILVIGSDMRATDLWCDSYPGNFAREVFTQITFGQGLYSKYANGHVYVSGGMQIQSTNTEATDSLDDVKYFEKIQFGKNLHAQSMGQCTVLVSATGGEGNVLVSNQGCDEPFTEGTISSQILNHIEFGSGIKVIDKGAGKYEAHSPVRIDNSTSSYNTTFEHDTFACVEGLNFGTGICVDHDVDNPNDCEVRLDTNIRLASVNPCDGSTQYTDKKFYKLHFSSGIIVEKAKDAGDTVIDNEYTIAAGGLTWQKDGAEAADIIDPDTAWGLDNWSRRVIFGTGLAVEITDGDPADPDNCSLLISPNLQIANKDCGVGTPGPYNTFHRLIMGTGLDMKSGQYNDFQIDAGIFIKNDETYEVASDNNFEYTTPIEKIKFGKNIKVEALASCEIGISIADSQQGSLTASVGQLCDPSLTLTQPYDHPVSKIITHKGIKAGWNNADESLNLAAGTLIEEHTECPIDGDLPTWINTLKVGKGLKMVEDEPCTGILALDLVIKAQYNKGSEAQQTKEQIHEITFDNCFYVDTADDCTATIHLDNSSDLGEGQPITEDTIVKVVTNVECNTEEGAIVVSYADMIFNSCGLFSKVEYNADPPEE